MNKPRITFFAKIYAGPRFAETAIEADVWLVPIANRLNAYGRHMGEPWRFYATLQGQPGLIVCPPFGNGFKAARLRYIERADMELDRLALGIERPVWTLKHHAYETLGEMMEAAFARVAAELPANWDQRRLLSMLQKEPSR